MHIHLYFLQPPRAEAVSILGTLLSFPNHYGNMVVLEPKTLTTTTLLADELKDLIVDMLLKAGKREPAGLARCAWVSFKAAVKKHIFFWSAFILLLLTNFFLKWHQICMTLIFSFKEKEKLKNI